ncbi:MAG: hypothetical protein ABDH31_05180 [Chlorobiota bacterium]
MKWLLVWLLSLPAIAQLNFTGIGPTVWVPYREINDAVRIGYGSSLVLGSRQYCQLWGLVGVHYYRLQMRDTGEIRRRPLPPKYEEVVSLEAALRFFPWHPTQVPLYGHVGLLGNGINARDNASPAGLGTAIGVGAVFPFSEPCCSWFLEASVQYALWNVLLRDEARPIVRSWLVGLHFRLGL